MRNITLLKSIVLSSAVLLTFSAITMAQQKVIGRSAIKTADGLLFIQNGTGKSFTIEIKGKKVEAKTVGDNPGFLVDGKLVQLVIIANKTFLNGAKDPGEDKLLELHRDWESDYLQKEMYKASFNVESEKIKIEDRKMLFWGFTRPSLNKPFDRDYFLTTIIGEGLLGLSSPVNVGESVADYKKFFLEIFSTLKVSDKPIDVLKLADEIRQSKSKSN